jgi:predicted transposase/invertase (TIGR01784 family)
MLMAEWKLEDALVVEREEGFEEGREEGFGEGREEGFGEAARNLLNYGMKAEQIAQALKLPLDTVRQYLD